MQLAGFRPLRVGAALAGLTHFLKFPSTYVLGFPMTPLRGFGVTWHALVLSMRRSLSGFAKILRPRQWRNPMFVQERANMGHLRFCARLAFTAKAGPSLRSG